MITQDESSLDHWLICVTQLDPSFYDIRHAKERDEYLQCLVDLKQSILKFCDFHHAIPPPTARAA